MSYISKFTGKEIDNLLDKVNSGISNGNFIQSVLFEGKHLITANTSSDKNLLSDNIKNYDYITLTTGQEVPSGAYSGMIFEQNTILVDTSSIYVKDNMPATISQWVSEFDRSGDYEYLVTGNFGDGTQLVVAKFVPGSVVSERNHYITKVVGFKIVNNSNAVANAENPIGTIIPYMGLTAPEDYLVCDGAILNISDYPKLAEHFEEQFGSKNHFGGNGTTTFAIPDLRNEFLRGYHNNKEEQLSGEIGIHQEATIEPRILVNGNTNVIAFYSDELLGGANPDKIISASQSGHKISSESYTASGVSTASYTSRPTNVAVLFCIKCTESNNNSGESSTFKKQVLFEGEFSEVQTMSEANLLSDNIFNYDVIYLTTYQKTNNVKYRIHTTTIDPSTLRVSEATSLWTSSVHYDTHGYYLGGNFGDGTQLYITESIPGTKVADREHGICKVVGIKY